MPLECNIDSRGRLIRLIYGVVLAVAGMILLWLWAIPSNGWLSWLASIAIILAGGFAVFEGSAGWCVVRAMGWKTPI